MKRMLALILCSLSLLACSKDNKTNLSNRISIKGSDTMVHLASNWAEGFMTSSPNVDIAVTGGGSGTGIAALLNGTTDICAASRHMKQDELDTAKAKGMDIKEVPVALDGIAIIVNPANPVESLSLEQLRKMYTGIYTSWSLVGGPDKPITLLSRESSSGTYAFFQEEVLNKGDFAPSARLLPSTSAIIQSIANDEWSIGYVGLGYAESAIGKVKIIAVSKNGSTPVMPSVATIKDGSYPLSRPLYFYYDAKKQAHLVEEFIKYCLSETGQDLVKRAGYITIR